MEAAEELSFHVGLAEQGKIDHLAGKDTLALGYFREALKRAVSEGAAEIFFRYYMHLSLEVLEKQGHAEEVVEYCDRAISHYGEQDTLDQYAAKDLIDTWQRKGICLMKIENITEALKAFNEANKKAAEYGINAPLAKAFLPWVSRSYTIRPEQLERQLKDQKYFSIRPDTIDKNRAIRLEGLERSLASAG